MTPVGWWHTAQVHGNSGLSRHRSPPPQIRQCSSTLVCSIGHSPPGTRYRPCRARGAGGLPSPAPSARQPSLNSVLLPVPREDGLEPVLSGPVVVSRDPDDLDDDPAVPAPLEVNEKPDRLGDRHA